MKKIKLLALCLAAFIILAALPAMAQSSFIGEAVQDFTVTSSDGESITLSDCLKKYKVVVLNFWYSGCGWCEFEFPFLEEYYQTVSDDVLVLALNPEDANEDIADYKEAHGLSFPMAQVDGKIADYFQVRSYPTTVVIDSDGICQAFVEGAMPSTEDFAETISPFIGASEPQPAEPEPTAAAALQTGEGVYTIKFVDQNGDPVTNITAQLCDDSTCNLLAPDENGILKYTGEVHSYELHLLEIPNGYSFDLDKAVPLYGGAIEYTIELQKLDDTPQAPDNQIKTDPTVLIIVIAAVVVAITVLVCVIIIRKRSKQQ